MRINIIIEGNLMTDALKASKLKTQKEVVELGKPIKCATD
jgi:Arc/MetJ family transcription regulator